MIGSSVWGSLIHCELFYRYLQVFVTPWKSLIKFLICPCENVKITSGPMYMQRFGRVKMSQISYQEIFWFLELLSQEQNWKWLLSHSPSSISTPFQQNSSPKLPFKLNEKHPKFKATLILWRECRCANICLQRRTTTFLNWISQKIIRTDISFVSWLIIGAFWLNHSVIFIVFKQNVIPRSISQSACLIISGTWWTR